MNLKIFFKENNIQQETIKHEVTDRFGEEGKTWTFKVLKTKQFEALKDRFTKKVTKKGVITVEFDNKNFVNELTLLSIVEPNLNDKELQDSYGILAPIDLLQEILEAKEYNALQQYILTLYDMEEKEKNEIEEIKN